MRTYLVNFRYEDMIEHRLTNVITAKNLYDMLEELDRWCIKEGYKLIGVDYVYSEEYVDKDVDLGVKKI